MGSAIQDVVAQQENTVRVLTDVFGHNVWDTGRGCKVQSVGASIEDGQVCMKIELTRDVTRAQARAVFEKMGDKVPFVIERGGVPFSVLDFD